MRPKSSDLRNPSAEPAPTGAHNAMARYWERRSFSYIRVPLRILLAASLVAGLGACASMSEEECLAADWKQQGYRDGVSGYPSNRVEDHREACAKVGVVPDLGQYRSGWDAGIREYCTPANALNEGRRGHSYRNSCPVELEPAFRTNYQIGYRVYQAEQRVDSLSRDLRNKERELDREKDDRKRKNLRRDLRDLDDRLARARRELYDAERHLYRVTSGRR